MSIIKGALYVVATPMGHLGDASERSLQVLSEVDAIAAEDTRRTMQLLRHFGIDTPCIALHEHNERSEAPRLVQRLGSGQAIALVSDAGTPLVSDPGYHLVRAVQDAACRVVPVPGPSALTAALSVSGQPADAFVFEGFLPARSAARSRRLTELRDESRTLVFYEAPHRVLETLNEMAGIMGSEREATYVRELSKVFETVRRDTLGRLAAWVESDPDQRRGEIVIVMRGAIRAVTGAGAREVTQTLEVLLQELPLKRAVSVAAKLTGVARNRLYQQALVLKEGREGGE